MESDTFRWKDEKQKEYYKRTTNFLKSDKEILINPGGMGLGKTLATLWAISDNFKKFPFVFITNPTATLKYVWAREINKRINTLNNYMIWYAKDVCCIKKNNNKSFNTNNCNDDCQHWQPLGTNKEISLLGQDLLTRLELPIKQEVLFDTKIGLVKICYLPLTRYGMKKRNLIIGDYFGVLNKRMFKLVTKKENGQGCLIIDEAHLLPERAQSYLSKDIRVWDYLQKLKKEIECDFIIRNIKLYATYVQTIITLQKIFNKLKESTIPNQTNRYTYLDFNNDYYSLFEKGAFDDIELFIKSLLDLSEQVYNDTNPWINSDSPYCKRLALFLAYWREKGKDKNYSQYFQYSAKSKDDIYLRLVCHNTGEYISKRFNEWNQVVLNSGTISDVDYFKFQLGIEKFDYLEEPHIDSYDIKQHTVIYPKDSFISSQRKNTYDKNVGLLNKIIKSTTGRTLIFIQNKRDSLYLQDKLKEHDIVNFCQMENGYEISAIDFDKCMTEFNNKKKGVGILNLLGKVEGNNFLDNFGNSVKNIIIYGYPYPYTAGVECQDQIMYYKKMIGNEQIAKKWVVYVPILNKIHQACCRAKRKKEDKPIILLWDNAFSPKQSGRAFSYMPDDLKGKVIWTEDELISYIKKKEDERKNKP